MIGRIHGVHAEPVTFGPKMALMEGEFGRGLQRLLDVRAGIVVCKLSGEVGVKYMCRKLMQASAMKSWGTGASMCSLPESDPVIMSRITVGDLDRVFKILRHFRNVDPIFRMVGL